MFLFEVFWRSHTARLFDATPPRSLESTRRYRAKALPDKPSDLQAAFDIKDPELIRDLSCVYDMLSAWREFTTLDGFILSYTRKRMLQSLRYMNKYPIRWMGRVISARINSCSREVLRNSNTHYKARRLVLSSLRAGLLIPQPKGSPVSRGSSSDRRLHVAVPTHCRPALLYRTLTSASQSARTFDHDVVFIVSDDGESEAGSENVRWIQRFTREERREVIYLGRDYRRDLKELLYKSGCSAATTAFCCTPTLNCGFGANRNTLLLACMGERVLFCDDDVALEPRNTTQRGGINGSADNVTRVEVIDGTIPTDDVGIDLIGAHLDVLNATLRELFSNASTVPINTCEHVRRHYLDGSGRVGYSMSGSYGDSGMHSDWPLLSLGKPGALLPHGWKPACSNWSTPGESPVLRWVDACYVGHSSAPVTMCYGQDLLAGCVPFSPSFRNEDGFMGCLSSACFPHLFWAYLPIAIEHAPTFRESFRLRWDDGVNSLRVADVLSCLVSFLNPHVEEQSTELFAHYGEELIRIGSLPQDQYEGLMRIVIAPFWRARLARLDWLERNLPLNPLQLPLDRGRDRLAKRIADAYCYRGTEFFMASAHNGDEDRQMRRYLIQFGELLTAWPSMVTATHSPAIQSLRNSSIISS